MKDKSVVLMKPGTQKLMKHAVRSESKSKKSTSDLSGIRYSLSFRALSKRKPTQTPKQSDHAARTPSVTTVQSETVSNSPVPLQPVSHQEQEFVPRRVSLIAGDSYAARLDPQRLGRQSVKVVSVARGGARMHHVMDQLREFKSDHSTDIVEKICLSVGTNDIRFLDSKGIDHLKSKFKSLCSLIKELYPESKIYFQLLLPLPCKNKFDWKTNSNVIAINRIIVNECIFQRFHVLDAFQAFSMRFRDHRRPDLRDDRLFDGNNIHPSERKGLGVLARLYIRALHSQFFDPFLLQ